MASNSKNNSRFSTLKVFKFAGSKGEGRARPPLPPPKDNPYYLNNRSLTSLSPDSPLSLPTTPLSPDYARRPSPAPSHSVVSLRSLGSSLSPPLPSPESAPYTHDNNIASSSSSIRSAISQKKSLFNFSSLGKRAPKSTHLKAEDADRPPPEPVDDDGISTPWNFQHHIHVDEGYIGLPPSWSSALSEAGFSEDEIMAIHSRRNAARQSTAQYLYTDRPNSPATLLAPLPRTTSLPRSSTNGSIASSSYPHLTHTPSLGVHSVSSAGTHGRQLSASSRQLSFMSSSSADGPNSDAQYVFINDRSNTHHSSPDVNSRTPEIRPITPSASDHSSNHAVPTIAPVPPRTPPRRLWHVTNDLSPDPSSPPPAYKSIAHPSTYSREKNGRSQASTSRTPPREDTRDDGHDGGEPEEDEPQGLPKQVVDKRLNRLTALPPRLSFHQDNDLTDWAGSLFSAISPPAQSPEVKTPSTSKSCPSAFGSPSSLSPEMDSLTLRVPLTPSSSTSRRPPPPRRPIPPILPDVSLGAIMPTGDQLMALSDAEETSLYPKSPDTILTPALSDGHSPIVPPPAAFKIQLIEPRAANHNAEHLDGDRDGDEALLNTGERDPNRDSGMSTVTVTGATIVKDASIARRAVANVIDHASFAANGDQGQEEDEHAYGFEDEGGLPRRNEDTLHAPVSPGLLSTDSTPRQSTRYYKTPSIIAPPSPMRGSPHSSFFSSESSSTNMESLSESSSSSCPDAPLNTPKPIFSKGSISPSPLQKNFGPDLSLLISTTDTFGGVVRDEYGDDEDSMQTHSVSSVIEIEQDVDGQEIEYAEESLDVSPLSLHAQQYPQWIAQAIAPLREFVVPANPRQLFADLQEVAEGDSGSVYAARVLKHDVVGVPTSSSHLAIKSIAIPQTGSAKFKDLQREMKVMKGIRHENILCMDALYVDLVDDSLWIRMELMERSLADVVGLVSEGLSLQERMIGRFASDVLLALEYLQKQHIAHRDVRSDNLLLNSSGVVKLADFSNAARLARDAPMCFEAVGVIYWQAPEMRAGAYNAMKVDVWSLGATVWELAQTEPPFADVQDPREIGDQWPSLSHPEYYSRAFHDFLRLCSRPSSSRPNPSELLNTPFIRNACGRAVNVQLLSQCRAIEENIMQRENDNS